MKITVKKHEWHQVDSQYYVTFGIEELQQLYPDTPEEDLLQLLQDIAEGNQERLEEVIEDDWGQGYLEFDHDYDDWWTQRKGGYDITYEIMDVETDDEQP